MKYEHAAKRDIEAAKNDLEDWIDAPHGELQSIVDRLEGAIDPFGDFAQGDDFDVDDYPN